MNDQEGLKVLQKKIADKSAVIGIIGLGYVGLPLVQRFAHEGFKVIGLDIDEKKVVQLKEGQSYIAHIPAAEIQTALKKGFTPSTDFRLIAEADAIIICVPTPLDKNRVPDLSYISNTMTQISDYLRKDQILSLESTTYPGTTEDLIVPRIKQKGFQIGEDFFVIYSPEREDPGNAKFSTKTIPKVCGGWTENCLKHGVQLYGAVVDKVVPVSSTKTAEMVKLLENIHRAVNIGLVNEMKIVADKMGIDIHEVIAAASTKPFGFTAYYPGPGWGGHCIPIDPFYLTWKAREYQVNTRFIELAGEVNTDMPTWVINKISEAYNERGLALKNLKFLMLGVAYKKNVDDMRESPAIELLMGLQAKGAKVDYSDPYIPIFRPMRKIKLDLQSIPITVENLLKYDGVIVATDHDDFDYDLIIKHSKLVIDTRGRYKHKASNLVKA